MPDDLLRASRSALNSPVSPWHPGWTRRATAGTSIPSTPCGATTVASAHGPLLSGDAIDDAFDRLRALAGAPIIPTPGQELLDELIAPTLDDAAP